MYSNLNILHHTSTTKSSTKSPFQDGCDKLATGLNNIITTNIKTQGTTTQRTTTTINKRRIKLPTNITTIGTWNVRTLNEIGQFMK